jgi:DNA-binding CsgD family transcriptional regulator
VLGGLLGLLTRMFGWFGSVIDKSEHRLCTYRSRLMQKLDIDSFASLVRFAIACGLTPP